MDLSDISRERTLIDLAVARARIVDLTLEIDLAAAELDALRAQMPQAPSPVETKQAKKSQRQPSGRSMLASFRRSSARSAVLWHIDEICGDLPSRSKEGIDFRVLRNEAWMMTISGWVVPNDNASAYTSVRLLMTGPTGVVAKQASIHLRDDVAAHFENPAFAMSGFRFEFPLGELEAGVYGLDLVPFSERSGEARVSLGRIEVA